MGRELPRKTPEGLLLKHTRVSKQAEYYLSYGLLPSEQTLTETVAAQRPYR